MEAKESLRTPRTDLENDLADRAYARLYRRARILSQREIDLCIEAHKEGMREVVGWIRNNLMEYLPEHKQWRGPSFHGAWECHTDCERCRIDAQLKEWGLEDG